MRCKLQKSYLVPRNVFNDPSLARRDFPNSTQARKPLENKHNPIIALQEQAWVHLLGSANLTDWIREYPVVGCTMFRRPGTSNQTVSSSNIRVSWRGITSFSENKVIIWVKNKLTAAFIYAAYFSSQHVKKSNEYWFLTQKSYYRTPNEAAYLQWLLLTYDFIETDRWKLVQITKKYYYRVRKHQTYSYQEAVLQGMHIITRLLRSLFNERNVYLYCICLFVFRFRSVLF